MAVGFFTHGIKFTLPHPKIPRRIILLVCKVIEKAWQFLEEAPPTGFDLHSASENTITQALVQVIEDRFRQSGEIIGFNCALFGRVTRDQKVPNFDNKHPDKMPDIFFDLKRDKLPNLSSQDGLFVECKPVDRSHPLLSCYCKEGLIRFVNGDYAWAMQNALMVGYVKNGASYIQLASILDKTEKCYFLNTISHYANGANTIYSSTHDRCFKWPESCGPACSIEVLHLWLCK
jgi:hypothetical protein